MAQLEQMKAVPSFLCNGKDLVTLMRKVLSHHTNIPLRMRTLHHFFGNIYEILGIDNKKEIHIINTVRYRTIKENQDGREKRVVRGGYWKTD